MTYSSFFSDQQFFYITPDCKRAAGLERVIPNCHIICNSYDETVEMVRKSTNHIFCLEENIGKKVATIKNSGQLISHPLVLRYIKEKTGNVSANILYFKPNLKIDLVCSQEGFNKIGNDTKLNEMFENKISFASLLQDFLPKYSIESLFGILSQLDFQSLASKLSLPYVVQFGHGWAGNTTFIINEKEAFAFLQKKYPHTNVKVSRYVDGVTLLNNACVYKKEILISDPALQISGINILSQNKTTTCGRQWPYPQKNEKITEEISHITKLVGTLMQERRYKGFFGLDFVIENKTQRIFISECNARLTASTPFYSLLEYMNSVTPLILYHLAAFTDIHLDGYQKPKNIEGSQIILRNTKDIPLTMNTDLKSGRYTYTENILTYIDSQFGIDTLGSEDYGILFRKNGDSIKPDDEVARVEIKKNSLNTDGQLETRVENLIQTIKEHISLT